MIAPILPGAEGLVEKLKGKVEHVIVDRLNYNYANRIYKEHGLGWANSESFFSQKSGELEKGFQAAGIPCRIVFEQ